MKLAFYILITIITTMCTASCTIFHTSENGDLDGFWLLTDVDSIVQNKSVGFRGNKICWSFQGELMQTQNLGPHGSPIDQYVYRFEFSNNQLHVSQPHLYNRLEGDSAILYADILQAMGINHIETTFDVEKLNKKNMILADDVLRLYFEKY